MSPAVAADRRSNFFNFRPWLAAIDLLGGIGVDRIEEHDQSLVDRLTDGITRLGFALVSPEGGAGDRLSSC